MKKIALQLYSVREYAKNDFISTLKKVAAIGFKAVEPAGFWGVDPAEFKKIVEDLGMEICSSHSPWARDPHDLGAVMDMAHAIGQKRIICGYSPQDFENLDAIKKTAENTLAMMEILDKNGFSMMQHNHYWEFTRLDGRLKYEIYRELCPGMKYQIDCYWSSCNGTVDPCEVLKTFKDDIVSIHMKDGAYTSCKSCEMKNGYLDCKIDLLPLGDGELPIADLVPLIPGDVPHIIVELDYCSIEMFEALQRSYNYLTSNGLAVGKK